MSTQLSDVRSEEDLCSPGTPAPPWWGAAELRSWSLTRPLGEGATARVFLGHAELEGGQKVECVFKIARPGMEEPLLREGRALAILGGQGTPRLCGVTRRDGAMTLVLSSLAGRTLDQLVLPEAVEVRRKWATAILSRVGRVLERAHGCGFAHHDVKPENVLLDTETLELPCQLIDWGLASDAAFVTSGTPVFLPPVVLRGARISGPQADVYALARTLAGLFAPDFWSDPDAGDWSPVPSDWERLLRPLIEWRLPTTDVVQFLRRAEEDGFVERGDRDPWLLRSQYLAVRVEAEKFRAPSRAAGRAGAWLQEWSRAQEALLAASEASVPEDERLPLGEPAREGGLTKQQRARLLARLLGPGAGEWELPATSDDALIEALERLSAQGGLRGATRYQLLRVLTDAASQGEARLEGNGVDPQPAQGALDVVDCALRLGAGTADAATLRSVLELEACPERLRVEAGRQARLAHDFSLAARLLDGSRSREGLWEQILVLKRSGSSEAIEPQLAALQEKNDAVASRARALTARMELDAGKVRSALERLSRDPGRLETCATFEVRALAQLMLGEHSECAASLDRGEALAEHYEDRARLVSLRGMLHHRLSQPQAAIQCFRQAADFARRAGAPLEEATFLTGVAASASDIGLISLALDASERAERLFEALRLPQQLPRVLLTQASVLASLGLRGEVEGLVRRGRRLSRRAGDRRCEAYFELCLGDVLPKGQEKARAAERAMELLASGSSEDRLHAAARVLMATSVVHPEADGWADASEHFEAKLAWYGARAGDLCRSSSVNLPVSLAHGVLDKIRALSQGGRQHAMLGPTLVSGGQLALLLGEPETARECFALAEGLAQQIATNLRSEHVEQFRRLGWVEQAQGTRIRGESAPQQLSDVEGLLRTLTHRGDFRVLLEQALDMLLLWTGVQRGLILLRAPGDRLAVRAGRNIDKQSLDGAARQLSQSIAQRALSEGRPVVMVDAAADGSALHRSFVALRLRSVLAVPLVARGQTQGVAYLDDQVRRGAFGQRELAWAQLIGTVLALSICDERDRLLMLRTRRRAERAELQVRRQLESRERELDVARRQLSDLQADGELRGSYPHIIGRSRPMKHLLSLMDRVAQSEVPTLIVGESGTGKELVARAIAREGSRREAPFIAENCAAVPDALFESTLFGHERGAFTGAHRKQDGLFRLAHGGTLFLDEIGDMPLDMQTKLLRVLQEGTVRPVGASRSEVVDVRLIAATHRDLEAMVKKGTFREDLFYRLNVVSLRVPPLRERREDIAPLVAHFMQRYSRRDGESQSRSLSDVALTRLVQFDWPGNVRQLENEVRRMLVLGGQRLSALDLSPEIVGAAPATESEPTTLREKVDALEKRLVAEALETTGGNRTKAAELLGLSRYGLQKMTARLGVGGAASAAKLDGSGTTG